MNTLATTIEQSKHLLELGLSTDSADMWWSNRFVYWKSTPMIGIATEQNQLYTFKWCDEDVPAWSLSALLKVMPKEIKKDDKQYSFHLETTHNLYYVSYYRYDIDGIRYLHTTELNNCTIDAAYEIVCWLLEQGLIKKGGQDGM